ncbi:MAG: hypothetical protein ABSF15_28475 [Candidatus Sulfotelmatobacter sp.]|jgi:hypothetical protein
MRKIRIIEHISLDGVIQATGGPEEDTNGFAMADGRGRMPTRKQERPSSRLTARLSICCWAAEPTISGAAFGLKPRKVRWRTA